MFFVFLVVELFFCFFFICRFVSTHESRCKWTFSVLPFDSYLLLYCPHFHVVSLNKINADMPRTVDKTFWATSRQCCPVHLVPPKRDLSQTV